MGEQLSLMHLSKEGVGKCGNLSEEEQLRANVRGLAALWVYEAPGAAERLDVWAWTATSDELAEYLSSHNPWHEGILTDPFPPVRVAGPEMRMASDADAAYRSLGQLALFPEAAVLEAAA